MSLLMRRNICGHGDTSPGAAGFGGKFRSVCCLENKTTQKENKKKNKKNFGSKIDGFYFFGHILKAAPAARAVKSQQQQIFSVRTEGYLALIKNEKKERRKKTHTLNARCNKARQKIETQSKPNKDTTT